MTEHPSFPGATALLTADYRRAVEDCARLLATEPHRAELLAFNLALARRRWRAARRTEPTLHAVVVDGHLSCLEAAREALSSAEVAAERVVVIEAGDRVEADAGLQALAGAADAPPETMRLAARQEHPSQLLDLVLSRPVDVVHLGDLEPAGLLLGLLYVLCWGTDVVVHGPPTGEAAEGGSRADGAGRDLSALRRWREGGWKRPAGASSDPADRLQIGSDDLAVRLGGVPVAVWLSNVGTSERPLPPPGELFPTPGPRELFEAFGGWSMFADPPEPVGSIISEVRAERQAAPAPPVLRAESPEARTRVIVYSTLIGGYEALKEPEAVDPHVRYILFTDRRDLVSERWEIVHLDTLGLTPRRASRLPKLLPHRYLPDHDISVYLDASLTLVEPDVLGMAVTSLKGCDLAAYPHFQRGCVFDEIDECIRLGKAHKKRAEAFRKRLSKEKFPKDWGLLENAFLIRRNTPVMNCLNDLWFDEYINGPERDQFSLMYVLWRAEIPHAVIDNARDFRHSPHLRFERHHGATACDRHPSREEIDTHFGFLKGVRPSSLVSRVENVVTRLASFPDADGTPAVSSKAMREAVDAIMVLSLLGDDGEQKCHKLLSRVLFPEAVELHRQHGMKLAYLPNSAMPSTAANNVHVMKMCAALAARGMEVVLYAEREGDASDPGSEELQRIFGTQTVFPVVLQPKDKRGGENLKYRLVRQAIADGCTHIYTRSLEVALYACLADVPVILEEHKETRPENLGYLQLVARSPALERLVVISQALVGLFTGVHREIDAKFVVLHDAADPVPDNPPHFDLGPRGLSRARAGYVGHLYPGKGAELSVELARRMPDVDFHMLGGTPEDVAAWQSATLDLPNLVFHGHRPHAEVTSFIAEVDICIAPFLREVRIGGGKYNVAAYFSPLKIFEYMAHGKPIVTSDLPVLREVLTDGDTALLCDPDHPESFVAAINRLIEEPDLARRLGQRAREVFEARFTWDRRAEDIFGLLHARPRIDPPPPARPRPASLTNAVRRPVVRWYFGGENQAEWAYGINARRLSSRIPSCDHIAPGSELSTATKVDVALAFDILIMTGEKFNSSGASKNILRVGGPNPLKIFSGGNQEILAETLEKADAIIALSPQLRDQLSLIHPSVHFIPNGIDIDAYAPRLRRRDPNAPFRVGMSASVVKEVQRHTKGYYFALEACEQAGVDLLLIGRGVNQIPHDRLLEDFYSQIDVLLHPVGAGKEASSNVMMEALALGVPVVTTRHAGFHGVALAHGREGLIMRRTSADFAEAIRALRADAKLRQALASGGRAFVERHHALQVVAREYEDVIWTCLRR